MDVRRGGGGGGNLEVYSELVELRKVCLFFFFFQSEELLAN